MMWSNSPYCETVKVAILRRFKVHCGKEAAFKDCLDNLTEISPNSPGRVESVFTRTNNQGMFIYWLSIDKLEFRSANARCDRKLLKTLKDCIDLSSLREFQSDQSMFEELKGPTERYDQYLSGSMMACLVEAAVKNAVF